MNNFSNHRRVSIAKVKNLLKNRDSILLKEHGII